MATACMTWQEMYGSGLAIGIMRPITDEARLTTQKAHALAWKSVMYPNTAPCAAVAGLLAHLGCG